MEERTASDAHYPYDVFLSYASADLERVRYIAGRLKSDGLVVWFDKWSIEPGAIIFEEIQKGADASRVLVGFLSKASLVSGWGRFERAVALFRDPINEEGRFIPVLLDDCEEDIPGALE